MTYEGLRLTFFGKPAHPVTNSKQKPMRIIDRETTGLSGFTLKRKKSCCDSHSDIL
jgi:hypothetical protein